MPIIALATSFPLSLPFTFTFSLPPPRPFRSLPDPIRMKLQTVPTRQGALWVRQGFQVFFRQPMAFAALFAAFMFGVFVVATLPFFGTLLVLAWLPVVSLGFMLATRLALGGHFATPRVFIVALRPPRARQIAMVQLGLAYALGTFAIVWLCDGMDGGAFEALMDALPNAQTAPQGVANTLADSDLWWGLSLRLALAGALSVPFWHAPALVFWDGHGVAKALFSSTIACWRNRGAFAVYSVAWFALVSLVGVGGSLVFGLLGQPQLFALAAVPMSLMLTTVFYASLYFTFADCFSTNPVEPTNPSHPGNAADPLAEASAPTDTAPPR